MLLFNQDWLVLVDIVIKCTHVGRYMKVQSSMHCVFPTCLCLCVFLWLWLWLCVLCLCNVLMFLCVVKQNVFCGVVAPPPEIEPWPNLLWLPRGADTHQLMYCIHDLMTGLWHGRTNKIQTIQTNTSCQTDAPYYWHWSVLTWFGECFKQTVRSQSTSNVTG